MKTSSGFTIIELLTTVIFLGVVGTILFAQRQSILMMHRDHDRKVAINTIHYNLEEVVRPKLNGYPRTLNATQLTAMNSSLLKDPEGHLVGTSKSDYRYEPTGCNGGDICAGYSLRAELEREAEFIRTNPKL